MATYTEGVAFNTRLKNRYDSYADWTAANPVLLEGEIAIVTVPAAAESVNGDAVPATLIKVGDGDTAFKDLPFLSAYAADVYDWAKGEDKPEYKASEITDLATYINNTIQDTNTQYKLEQDTSNSHIIRLYSKDIDDTTWTDTGCSFTTYDDSALAGHVSDLETKVGDDTVANQIAAKITELDLPNTYALISHDHEMSEVTGLVDALAGKQEAGDYATKAEAKGYADDKDAAIAKAQAAADNAQKTADNAQDDVDGLKIVKTTSNDYAAVYTLQTKDGDTLGASINIPKDMVVESGSVVTNPDGQDDGTYIKLVLQNVTDPLYIDVGTLIEYVTSGSATGDMVVVNVSDDHKVTATITDGTITLAKLDTDVQAKISTAYSQAHTHGFADEAAINSITAGKVANWDAAYSQTHTHSFSDEAAVNSITSAMISQWNTAEANVISTVSDEFALSNEKLSVNSIAATKVSGLADVATTGNVDSLIQTSGTYIVLNGGNATGW